MAGLGNLVVKILGDTKDVKAKLNDVDKRLKTFTKTTEKHTKTLGSSIKKMMMWGAAIAGAIMTLRKMSQFISGSIRASIDYENALMNLSTVIKSTGFSAGFTANEMVKMADGLQSVTTYSNTAVMEAQGMLSTFTKIGQQTFPQTLESALDLSIIMKQDLRSSIVMLGKAMNDPIANLGALGRSGIQFSKDQKELIKTLWESGRTLEAQNLILKELKKQFGGVARAASETFGGKIEVAKNLVSDFRRELGNLMKEGLEPILDWTIEFLRNEEKINRMLSAIKQVSLAMVTLGKFTVLTLKSMGAYFNYFVVAILLAGNAMRLALNPKKWGTGEAKAALKGLADYTTDTFKAGFAEWKDIFVETKEKWIEVWGGLKEKTTEVSTGLITVTAPAIEEVKEDLSDLAKEVVDQFTVWDANIDKWNTYYRLMKDSAHPIMVVKVELSDLAKEMQKDITVWDATIDKWDTYARIMRNCVDPIKQVANANKEAVSKIAEDTNWMSSQVGGIYSQLYQNQSIELSNWYQQQKDHIENTISDEEEKEKALDALDKEARGKRRALAVQEKGFRIFRSIIDTAAAVTLALSQGGFIFGIPMAAMVGAMGAVQTALIAAQPIPLAEGGIIEKPTYTVMGESGREAVIPLNKETMGDLGASIATAISKQGVPGGNIPGGAGVINAYLIWDGKQIASCVNQQIVDGKIHGRLRGQ